MKLTTDQVLYRQIRDGNHGRDVDFIADCILTCGVKPVSRLRILSSLLIAGREIRCGNEWGSIVIDGKHYRSFSVLDEIHDSARKFLESILALIKSEDDVKPAIDEVLGEGASRELIDNLYDALKKRSGQVQ